LTTLADWNCSFARTLDVVGEQWTLLIGEGFSGTRRFDDFQASLGLARSGLTPISTQEDRRNVRRTRNGSRG